MKSIILFSLLLIMKSTADLPSNQLNFNCLPDPLLSCGTHGTCINNGTFGFGCKCDNNWDSRDCPITIQCCHQLQSRVAVFLAAFFGAWTGAPYYLIGLTGMGAGIFILCCGGCCVSGLGKAVMISFEGRSAGCVGFGIFLMVLGVLATLSSTVWSLATWIMAAAGTGPFDGERVGSW